MYWNFDYTSLYESLQTAHGEFATNMSKAFKEAKVHFGYDKTLEDFIVIQVEGYHCIALVINDFHPIEIAETIFPFDKNRIYPMQGVVIEPKFKTF